MVFWSLKEFIMGFKSILYKKINILNPFIYFLRDQMILGRDITVCLAENGNFLAFCYFQKLPDLRGTWRSNHETYLDNIMGKYWKEFAQIYHLTPSSFYRHLTLLQ